MTYLLLAVIVIAAIILYLRQRISAAAVKPYGKDGVALAERLSEKRRWVMLKEKYGFEAGVVITLAVIGLGCGICQWMG